MNGKLTAALIVISGALGYYVGTTSRSDSADTASFKPTSHASLAHDRSTEDVARSQDALGDERARQIEDAGNDSAIFDASRIDEYLSEIEKLPPGPGKQRALETLFRKWGAASGILAYERAKGLGGRDRLACMSAAAAGWASGAPEEAWSEIMVATNNGSTSHLKLKPIIEEIARNDLGLAVQLLQRIDNQYYLQQHFQPLIDAAAEIGGYVDLLGIVQDLDSADKPGLLAEKIFETWGKYELDAPLEALSRIDDPAVASKALLGIMRGWAQVDGEAAFLYAVENSSDPKIAELLAPVAEQWSLSSSSDEVASLIEQVISIGDGGIVLSSISRSLAQRQPELTMDSIAGIENDRARSMTTNVVMGEWARTDLASAESYYKDMPYDQTKQQSFWALFNASMQQSKSPEGIIDLVFELNDLEAISRTLVSMAEYTTISPFRDRSLALERALVQELESREDISQDTKAKVLDWLTPEP